MPGIAILGAQFGDEGKGKITDFYADRADVTVRFQGGANAGHTIYRNSQKFVFHLLPVGIMTAHTTNVIACGCVVDIVTLHQEILAARQLGIQISPDNLKISARATVVLPTYIEADVKAENETQNRIGTTRRGIGPAYSAKASRDALQMAQITDAHSFLDTYLSLLKESPLYQDDTHAERHWHSHREALYNASIFLTPYITDTSLFLRDAHKFGRSIIFEGAQGALLDNDLGTYPHVTSSNTISSGVAIGAGIAPSYLNGSIGVAKAYVTRVGAGPFLTRMDEESHEIVQTQGKEFGATTGRPRLCGWLDLPALKYAVTINDYDGIIITKVDVLDTLSEIKVCTKYKPIDASTKFFESNYPLDLTKFEPVYETLEGWTTSTRGLRSIGDLPLKLREYLAYIERYLEVPIYGISTGPDTSSYIERRAIFKPLPLIRRFERVSFTSDLGHCSQFNSMET